MESELQSLRKYLARLTPQTFEMLKLGQRTFQLGLKQHFSITRKQIDDYWLTF